MVNWKGRWLLFGRDGGLCGNQFRSLLLEVGGFGRGASKVCLSKVGGKCGWGGVDIGDPGGATYGFRFYRPIGVQLKLNDGILADAGGLPAIEAINFPRAFFKGIRTGLFFPDRSVGVFAPLVAVAIAFPEGGLFGGGVEVKVAAHLSWDGGGTGVVFTEEFSCRKNRGEVKKKQRG